MKTLQSTFIDEHSTRSPARALGTRSIAPSPSRARQATLDDDDDDDDERAHALVHEGFHRVLARDDEAVRTTARRASVTNVEWSRARARARRRAFARARARSGRPRSRDARARDRDETRSTRTERD